MERGPSSVISAESFHAGVDTITTIISASATPYPPILTLPFEVLEMIIGYMFPMQANGRPGNKQNLSRDYAMTTAQKASWGNRAIVATCRKLYAVAHKSAYSNTEWLLSAPTYSEDLLRMPPACIRNMRFVRGQGSAVDSLLASITIAKEINQRAREVLPDLRQIDARVFAAVCLQRRDDWPALKMERKYQVACATLSTSLERALTTWCHCWSPGKLQVVIEDSDRMDTFVDVAERILAHRWQYLSEVHTGEPMSWTREGKHALVVRFKHGETTADPSQVKLFTRGILAALRLSPEQLMNLADG